MRRLPVLLLGSTAFSAAIHAQEQPPSAADSVSTLAAIEVVGQSSNNESYAAQTTTIGRREQTLREIPQSVSVLTRQRLDDQNLYSLDQALEQMTGVTVNPAPSGMVYDFYARGFPVQNVAFDGVQSFTGFGGFDNMPDTATIERVEVLRGADGLYSGAGQPGGAVNVVRKRPLADNQMAANLSAGSWSHKRGEFDVSQVLNQAGTVRARGVLAWQHNDVFFDAPSAEKRTAYAVLQADIRPHATLDLGLSYQKADHPQQIGHPRASDGRDLRLPRRRSFISNWNYYRLETTQAFADFKHRFHPDWNLQINALALKETSVFKGAYGRGRVDPVTGTGLTLAGSNGRYESRQYGLDATLDGRFRLFAREHGISIGANYIERDNPTFIREGWNFPEQGTPVDLWFDPNTIPEPATALMRKTGNRNTRQSGVYGVARWSLHQNLTLMTGARASWYEYENRSLSGTLNERYAQHGEITPYAGLVLDFHSNYTLYASYTDIFRVQSNLYQTSGSPLDPAVGKNYEMGLKSSTDDGRLNGSVAVFRIEETNRSQTDPDYPTDCPANPSGGACYLNAGEVRSQGFEAELNGEIAPGWHWFAGYTRNTTKYLRDRAADGTPSGNEGKPFRSIAPEHMLRVHTKYIFPGALDRWTFNAGMNFQSETFVGNDIIARQPGYTVWNAGLGYRAHPQLSLHVSVNNLLDKVYYRRINLAQGNSYGEPRSLMFSARARF